MTRPLVGASALGIAQAAYEWTIEYLDGRTEEGLPLAQAQRIQQTMADVATEIEAARLLVQRAAWMGRNGVPMRGGQGSMSKLKGGDVAMWATTTLMDLVGPPAWSTEYPLEKFFRDAKIYQLFEGTAEIQRMVISRMQAAEYAERLGYGAEVAAEAIAPRAASRRLSGEPASQSRIARPRRFRPCPTASVSLASLAMLQIRTALAALLAAAAALIVLLLSAPPAAAQDLSSKLEDKESKLSNVREREGVLTTTISHYGDRIDRLDRRGRRRCAARKPRSVRGSTPSRPNSTRRSPNSMSRKKHLAVVRARLKRALVTLRERLVAIYETGTPDMLSVIVGANGYDDLIARTEYLERIHGMDEAVVDRVRQLRDEVQANRRPAGSAKPGSKRPATRSPPNAGAGRRPRRRCRAASRPGRGPRATARRRSRKINDHEQKLEGGSPKSRPKSRPSWRPASAPLPAGPIRLGSAQLIWPVDGPVVSGFGMRWGGCTRESTSPFRNGTPIRAAAAGTVVLPQSESESGGYGNFTCLDHGGGLSDLLRPPVVLRRQRRPEVSQGQVIGYRAAPGTASAPHVHFEVRVGGVPDRPAGLPLRS